MAVPGVPAIPNISSGPAVSGNGDAAFDASASFGGINIGQTSNLLIPALVAAAAVLAFLVIKK